MNLKVLNRYKDIIPENSVPIYRPTKFGNPFILGKDGNRTEVIDKYINWIKSQPELLELAKIELKGKNLICCCSPKKCHGDWLLNYVNSIQIEDFYE